MSDDLNPAEARTAADFADAIRRGDYPAAVTLLTNVTNAGDIHLAAALLQSLVEAGAEAVAAMAKRRRSVSVTQTFTDIPKGATVIGYKGGSIG